MLQHNRTFYLLKDTQLFLCSLLFSVSSQHLHVDTKVLESNPILFCFSLLNPFVTRTTAWLCRLFFQVGQTNCYVDEGQTNKHTARAMTLLIQFQCNCV